MYNALLQINEGMAGDVIINYKWIYCCFRNGVLCEFTYFSNALYFQLT